MLENLIAARNLISDKNNWCTFNRAQNEHGEFVEPTDYSACQFCAVGAVQKVMGYDCNSLDYQDVYQLPEVEFLSSVSKVFYGRPIYITNDSLGHKEVLKVFDHAIQVLKESKETYNV